MSCTVAHCSCCVRLPYAPITGLIYRDGNVIGQAMSASSPDEEAFIYAAQSFQYEFVDRKKDIILIRVNGTCTRTIAEGGGGTGGHR